MKPKTDGWVPGPKGRGSGSGGEVGSGEFGVGYPGGVRGVGDLRAGDFLGESIGAPAASILWSEKYLHGRARAVSSLVMLCVRFFSSWILLIRFLFSLYCKRKVDVAILLI